MHSIMKVACRRFFFVWIMSACNLYNAVHLTLFAILLMMSSVQLKSSNRPSFSYVRPYQFNFMLLGPNWPKFWQMSFNNDRLRRPFSALFWEGLNHFWIQYHTADKLVHCQRWDSLCYSPPNTIAHCKRTCLSLAPNVFCDTFGTRAERVSCWRWSWTL